MHSFGCAHWSRCSRSELAVDQDGFNVWALVDQAAVAAAANLIASRRNSSGYGALVLGISAPPEPLLESIAVSREPGQLHVGFPRFR